MQGLAQGIAPRLLWPEPYWAQVLVRDKGSGTETLVDFPVLLPHEFFDHLVKANKEKLELFKASVDHAPELLPLVQEFALALGVDAAKVIPLGVHGDGVPFAAKMTDSLEQLSWNFCAQPASQRVLFTAIPKSAVAGRATWDALLAIFSWSMRQLALGVWPSLRHDGSPWGPKDTSRATKGGVQFPMLAALVQCRGDWVFYKQIFDFLSWSSMNICWKCSASKRGSA